MEVLRGNASDGTEAPANGMRGLGIDCPKRLEDPLCTHAEQDNIRRQVWPKASERNRRQTLLERIGDRVRRLLLKPLNETVAKHLLAAKAQRTHPWFASASQPWRPRPNE